MSDYAPEYTKIERLRIIAKHLAWAIPTVAIFKLWFFPWFSEYADNAHCYDYGYFSGTQLALYSVYVGIPIVAALLVFAIEGIRSLRVMRLGQSPLPGEKVFSPTKYKFGFRARVRPAIVLLMLLGMLSLGVYGISFVEKIVTDSDYSLDGCS